MTIVISWKTLITIQAVAQVPIAVIEPTYRLCNTRPPNSLKDLSWSSSLLLMMIHKNASNNETLQIQWFQRIMIAVIQALIISSWAWWVRFREPQFLTILQISRCVPLHSQISRIIWWIGVNTFHNFMIIHNFHFTTWFGTIYWPSAILRYCISWGTTKRKHDLIYVADFSLIVLEYWGTSHIRKSC